MQAPAPERPITGGMATEALLAHVLVAKYADFLPLYRQAQIFARQGIELDRSTLCDWVGRACWWLEPLWRLLRRHVMGSTRIFADDTPLPVLDPGRGRTKTGGLWGYAVDDRPWGGEHPAGGGLPLRRGPQGRAPGRPPGTWRISRLSVDDDALDDELQDRLLVGEVGLLEPRADPFAERGQARQHPPAPGRAAA